MYVFLKEPTSVTIVAVVSLCEKPVPVYMTVIMDLIDVTW